MQSQSIGVVGGGQLAWMLAQAAPKLGLNLWVQTPQAEDPAVGLAAGVVLAPVADAEGTARLAEHCPIITFENEFVDLENLEPLAERGVCFRPSLGSLAPLLDKLRQRQFLQALNLPVPRFGAYEAGQSLKFPCVLKARRQGYDGQGTHIFKQAEDWERRMPELALRTGEWLIEEFIPFERELALVAARSSGGEIAFFPVAETRQVDQVCRWALAPAPNIEAVESQIQDYGRRILDALDYVGVLGMELFLTPDGDLYFNELAPRVHNSGHFSQDACQTSQFALHLQAAAGLPLGSTRLLGAQALMVNLLGYESADKDYGAERLALARLPGAHVHWYQKNSARPGRKLGHVNFLFPEVSAPELIDALVNQVEARWRSSPE
ncbi:MAG: 5-(carboxyamino)imidazole ribonucleotide synthase [Cyanobacteria bacterium RI_101]|nr:5-(carboxyamino)imidazole ribonucleotide synthase [Cyanobacteria bacterium RI_101]